MTLGFGSGGFGSGNAGWGQAIVQALQGGQPTPDQAGQTGNWTGNAYSGGGGGGPLGTDAILAALGQSGQQFRNQQYNRLGQAAWTLGADGRPQWNGAARTGQVNVGGQWMRAPVDPFGFARPPMSQPTLAEILMGQGGL